MTIYYELSSGNNKIYGEYTAIQALLTEGPNYSYAV